MNIITLDAHSAGFSMAVVNTRGKLLNRVRGPSPK
jgi:hypothetical protein